MIIPHSRPVFDDVFQDKTTQVIASGFLAEGDETRALEADVATALGISHVLAVDSGTSALMLAIRALTDNKIGARIGIPSYACASLLFAVKAAGATPVFMDCTADLTLNTEQALNTAKTLDVLVLVHPFGMVEPLAQHPFPCPIIEDIAQSAGATLQGKPVGSFADICIGSFYATKPWGGAYGGFVASQNSALIATCKAMSNPDNADLDADYVGHHQLSNIHAGLARVSIQQSHENISKRQFWVRKYDSLFTALAAQPIQSESSNAFRYIVRCEQDAIQVITKLRQLGIAASRPVQQPLHRSDKKTACPHADAAWQHCVSLPLLADMREKEFDFIVQGLKKCFPS